ncbi:aminotransferase class III-fold pyridoxal phosphate-dependent enzyme [Chloroflexota bacterium]
MLIHSPIFARIPGSCAAAVATPEITEKEKLVENSKTIGEYLLARLQSLYKHNIVGEIWGGHELMGLIVLMKDKQTKKQFSPEENLNIGGMLKRKATDIDLFGMFINPIQICPPLIITKDKID